MNESKDIWGQALSIRLPKDAIIKRGAFRATEDQVEVFLNILEQHITASEKAVKEKKDE